MIGVRRRRRRPYASAVRTGRPATPTLTMQVTSQRAARALPDLAPPGASKVRVYAAQPVSDAVGDAVMPGASASKQWLDDLASSGPARDKALARLHELLLRGAHHEIRRRRGGLRARPSPRDRPPARGPARRLARRARRPGAAGHG